MAHYDDTDRTVWKPNYLTIFIRITHEAEIYQSTSKVTTYRKSRKSKFFLVLDYRNFRESVELTSYAHYLLSGASTFCGVCFSLDYILLIVIHWCQVLNVCLITIYLTISAIKKGVHPWTAIILGYGLKIDYHWLGNDWLIIQWEQRMKKLCK